MGEYSQLMGSAHLFAMNRIRQLSRGTIAFLAGGVLAACSVSPQPSVPKSAVTPLPTAVALPAPGCDGIPLKHFTVRMDREDRWLVWFDDSVLGRMNVYWPAGFGVQFEPEAVVVAPTGAVLFHDGQFVTESHSACRNYSGETTITWIETLE